MYLGSWKIDDYLTFTCNTHTPSTGAATDADSVPTYRVYEDETGTPVTNGSTAKLDDAGTTGFYSERIQLLTATGFEKGKTYTIYVSATVGAVIGTMSHTFQIEAEVDANTVTGSVPSVVGAVGSVTGSVGSVIGHTAQTGDSFAIVNNGTYGNSAIETLVDELESRLTAARAGYLDNISAGSVALASALATAQADLDTITGADGVTLATSQALYAPNKVVPDVAGTLATYDPPTNAEMVAAFTEIKGGTWAAGTDTLEALRDRGDAEWMTATGFSTHSAANVWAVGTRALTDKSGFALSATGIDAFWDDLISGMTQVGSIGKLIADNLDVTISSRNATTPPTVGAIRTEMEGAGTKLTLTLADTAELQGNQTAWATATSVTVSDKTGFALSAAGVDAILDENIEGTHTLREIMRLLGAYAAGKSSGGGTASITFRDLDDSKDRIVATVTSVGNRTAVTLTED